MRFELKRSKNIVQVVQSYMVHIVANDKADEKILIFLYKDKGRSDNGYVVNLTMDESNPLIIMFWEVDHDQMTIAEELIDGWPDNKPEVFLMIRHEQRFIRDLVHCLLSSKSEHVVSKVTS